LARAKALVYPVQRPEPFGLVLVEAMASGTPVLALNKGAVPEIVRQGETGFVGGNVEELIAQTNKLEALDRKQIRSYVEQQFSSEIMIDRIESQMREMVEGSSS
jgi:glycosyltransferase involved in cell wall biosynthesis